METVGARQESCGPQADGTHNEMDIQLKVIRTLSLRVKKSETVAGVKSLIRERLSVSEDYQELLFSGSLLKDGQRLLDYGVTDNSPIHVCFRNFVRLKLLIKLPSPRGRRVSLEVTSGDRVQTIKNLIQEQEGIDPTSFSLVHGTSVLEGDKSLASLDIKKDSILDLVFHVRIWSISVRTPKGETNIKIKSTNTAQDVKTTIARQKNVRVTDASLFYAGKRIGDGEMLASYNIRQGSVLELVSASYQIFVKTIYGKTATLDVHSSMSVLGLKEMIRRVVDIPVDLQSLFFEGKHVGNDGTLGEYKIEKDGIIFVRTRPTVHSGNWTLN